MEEMEEWEWQKLGELLRFGLSPIDRDDTEGGSRKKRAQKMSQDTRSYTQRRHELTSKHQYLIDKVLANLAVTHVLIDFTSFLDDHVTRLEKQDLPKEMAHLNILQSELHSHLKTVKAVARNPERIQEYFGTTIRLKSYLQEVEPILRQLGYKRSHGPKSTNNYSLIGESPSPPLKQQSHPSPVEEQAKMQGESFTCREQQVPRIQDTGLKADATVEDPFPTFLLDLPFSSADDDDDNKGKSTEQIANDEEMACEAKVFALHRRRWKDLWEHLWILPRQNGCQSHALYTLDTWMPARFFCVLWEDVTDLHYQTWRIERWHQMAIVCVWLGCCARRCRSQS